MRARVFALNFAYTEETKVEIERKFLVKKENLPRKEMLTLATRFGRKNWTPDPLEEKME